ncbi:MAG: hypothetical protein NC541_13570 [bacterium]|nr:hypothetical protein [bacterium]
MKKTVLYTLMDLVFLIVFNTLFFLLGGTEHPASVWLSYGFIHFAYLMVVATPFLTRKSSSAAVFGFAISSVSSAYFTLEFVVGLVFIFLRSESIKGALAVQIVIAGIYAVILFMNLIANEHTADAVARRESEVTYLKTAASRVKILIGKVSDKKADKALEKTYDLLHSSPTKSTAAVRSLETQIVNTITQLEEAVSGSDTGSIITLSNEIISLAEERNRKLRISQG